MFNKRFVTILAIEFCFQMGSFTVNPIVSSYIVAIGGAVAIGGFLAGLNSVSALAARPFVGASVDSMDFSKLLIVASALSCLSSFFCSFISSVAIAAICRIAFGIAFAYKSTVIAAMARLALPEDKVGVGLSCVSLLYVLANALGPLLGAELGARFGYHACFLVSAMAFACAFTLIVLLFREKYSFACVEADEMKCGATRLKPVGKRRAGFIYRPVVKLSIISGMVAFTLGSTNTLVVLAMADRSIDGASLFFFVAALSMLVSRPFAGRLCDRCGFASVFLPASAAAMLSMVCLALAQSLGSLIVAAVLMAFGQCTLTVLIQSEGMRRVPEEHVGRASNTLFLGPDIGMFLGPAVGGVVLQLVGPSALFLSNAAIVLLMVLFSFAARVVTFAAKAIVRP